MDFRLSRLEASKPGPNIRHHWGSPAPLLRHIDAEQSTLWWGSPLLPHGLRNDPWVSGTDVEKLRICESWISRFFFKLENVEKWIDL